MKTGDCALCGQLRNLHESHFLPKGIYRLLRDSNSKNNNPVLISARVSTQKSYQMTQPLLCSACERRFSANGESYVLPLLKQRGKFPMYGRLKVAIPLYTTSENAAFTCPSVGLDGEKIAYFGLSILGALPCVPGGLSMASWFPFDWSLSIRNQSGVIWWERLHFRPTWRPSLLWRRISSPRIFACCRTE